jgi:hypothetical protein
MLRFLFIGTLALSATSFADFTCPTETKLLERKDNVQWMKACLDSNNKLHGPFEVWSKPSGESAGSSFRKTIKGQYNHGSQTGGWTYWNIEGKKIAEKAFP